MSDIGGYEMKSPEDAITTVKALIAATKGGNIRRIVISSALTDAPTVSLSPGQSLHGAGEQSSISFVKGSDGLQFSSDNRVHQIRLTVPPDRRAIFNDTNVDSLGRIELRGVTAIGRVQILARDKVRGGHVDVNGLDIIEADAREESERPHGYGVDWSVS